MKFNSIRTKVLGALALCFLTVIAGILALLDHSFSQQANALADDSVHGAQRLFTILQTREISKLTALSEALIANPEIRDAFAAKDRPRLLAATSPLYPDFKREGVTNWLFHEAEPSKTVFLRLHNPGKFGDPLNRFMYDEAVRTHNIVTGTELAKAGFALRIMRPFYGANRQIIGYLELGEELGRFIRDMKGQAGDDYGLLLKKSLLDRGFWADSAKQLKRRDNWDDNPAVVLADKTTDTDEILRFQGDPVGVPDEGKVLERIQQAGSVYVRGIFPVADAANRKIGAMFVVRNITPTYQKLQAVRNMVVLVIVASLALCAVVLLALLTRLIFRRLDRIVTVATRVVGGDYESEIQVSSSDEIGQFEQLFEQFRVVFVNLLQEIGAVQQK